MSVRFWFSLVFACLLLSSAITVAYTIYCAALGDGSTIVHINRFGEAWLDYIFAIAAVGGGTFVVLDYVRLLIKADAKK